MIRWPFRDLKWRKHEPTDGSRAICKEFSRHEEGESLSLKRLPTFPHTLSSFPSNVRPLSGSVDIPWGIIELVLWRTALQADAYWTDVKTKGVALGY